MVETANETSVTASLGEVRPHPRVHQTALKHGVDPEDSIKAATEYFVAIDIEEGNPSKPLGLGFGSTGQLLETVV